jgi:hypothetical protein
MPHGRPVALFVLGTPRSGTSPLTRVLSLCGGTLPAGMLGTSAGHPGGQWEPRAALRLNEAILHRHFSAWYDPSLRLQEEGAFDAKATAACVADIGEFLTTLPAAPLLIIKDLQIAMLSGAWFEAARLAGFDVAVAIAVRHPQEVTASLASRAALRGVSPELLSVLWLKYSLVAERGTRGLPRVFVEYTELLDNWRRQINRISEALDIDLNTQDEGAIEEFLTPDLRRQRNRDSVTEPFGADWISTVYEALCAAARDEPGDGSALDGALEAYRTFESEHGFATAFEDLRDRFDGLLARLFRPLNQHLVETAAMAHRRRGTRA